MTDVTVKRNMKPRIVRRKANNGLYQSAIHSKASSFQADIISKRTLPSGIELSDFLTPSLSKIDSSKLKDINKAATRIIKGISMGEVIALVCDFDVDGVSSGTILYESLVNVFGCNPSRIKVFNSYRLKDGYGLTANLIDRIQRTNPTPTLIIAADQGSRDGVQITAHKKWAKKKGIISDIIVTDHHEVDDDNLPHDAYAFINPKQSNCLFDCEDICGASVALLLMAQVRSKLIEKGIRTKESLPPMGATLPLAAAATIDHCSSMGHPINRAFVHAGIKRMNNANDICWNAFRSHELQNNEPITSQTIGFKLAPIVNSASRMGKNALLGVKFFLARRENDALRYLLELKSHDEERKAAQQENLAAADIVALQQTVNKDVNGICVYQPNGIQGIHDVIASSIAQKYGKPTIIFAPKNNRKTRVKFDIIEKDSLNIDIFKKIPNLNEIALSSMEFIEVKKIINQNMPVFTLFRINNGERERVKELTISQASKLTKKNLFKGLGRTTHRFRSKMGDIILDLSKSTPTIYLEGVDEVTGSARTVHGVSLKNIFDRILKENPDSVVSCDGYDAAGYVTVKIDKLEEFKQLFNTCVTSECEKNKISLQPCYYSDGELPENRVLDLQLIDELNLLEPFGIGFERPAFEFNGVITKVEKIGSTSHYKLRFRWDRTGVDYNVLWNKAGENQDNVSRLEAGNNLRLLCELGDNYFRNRSIQLTAIAIVD